MYRFTLLTLFLLQYTIVFSQVEETPDTLSSKSLKLPGVEVTAQRNTISGTTTYKMDRMTLDHAQIVNLSDITTLLPGGKTVNGNLTNDDRLMLRAGMQEKGNAAFGTAVVIDGMRLDNNAMMDETSSPSTRNIAASNIESIEIISGIASVEYGDLSNGMVKVNTRRGITPWHIETSVNPHTWQIGFNKGFKHFNVSFEHSKSSSDLASPYTTYQRNVLSIAYNRVWHICDNILNIKAGITGNVGGYNDEKDPDAFADDYTKVRDNQLRAHLEMKWTQREKSYGTLTASLHGDFNTSDKRTETNKNTSSSTSIAYLHTMQNGYYIAHDADGTTNGIVMGPTGYWKVKSYNDQKPLSFNLKAKIELRNNLTANIRNKAMLGIELSSSRNNGGGITYANHDLAPTWRPYNYSALPSMNNLAWFIEETMNIKRLQLIAGLRNDITMISGSEYGTANTFSPRILARYDIIRKSGISLSAHAGWGQSYKMPSFQVLFPRESYNDILVFNPQSTEENKSYPAYYTHVGKAQYNKDLKWQHTNQFDAGLDANIHGVKVSLSAFWHKTYNPYQMTNVYTPFAYRFTSGTSVTGNDFTIDQAGNVYQGGSPTPLPSVIHHTYLTTNQYTNASPANRWGLEWVIDMPLSGNNRLVGSTLRLDGNYYYYKSVEQTMFATAANGGNDYALNSTPVYSGQPFLAYYTGTNTTSTGVSMVPSVNNGIIKKGLNLNATLTARIPNAGLIMTLRIESTLMNLTRRIVDLKNPATRILLQSKGDDFGTIYNGEENSYVATYPDYYSTWDKPEERIPFAEALASAYNNDTDLYNMLRRFIISTNTSYYMNEDRLSAYFSCNFSITKEIGKYLSISFHANNFLNNMSFIHSSQTNLDSSLFNSSYIPKFYYGGTLRIKI